MRSLNALKQWLSKISAEIEDRLINEPVEKRREVFAATITFELSINERRRRNRS